MKIKKNDSLEIVLQQYNSVFVDMQVCNQVTTHRYWIHKLETENNNSITHQSLVRCNGFRYLNIFNMENAIEQKIYTYEIHSLINISMNKKRKERGGRKREVCRIRRRFFQAKELSAFFFSATKTKILIHFSFLSLYSYLRVLC